MSQQTKTKSGVYLPQAGQRVDAGADLMIQWFYGDELRDSAPTNVDIELRDAVTGFPLRTVATNAPNHGYFFWNVDQHIQACDNAVVFVGNILAPYSAPSLFSAQFTLVAHSDRSTGATMGTNAPPTWSVSADSTTATNSVATHCSRSNCQQRQRPDNALEESFSRMSLDDAKSIECDSEDSLKCAKTRHANRKESKKSQIDAEPIQKPPLHSAAQSSQRENTKKVQEVREPIVWSEYADFICHAMYMCDTEIRRGLKQVVKNDSIDADSLLESGEPAGIFCVRYLLLKHYKSKITNDVFNAIRSNLYVPHPLLVRAWKRSPLFRVSQRKPVRAISRSRRLRCATPQETKNENEITGETSETTTTTPTDSPELSRSATPPSAGSSSRSATLTANKNTSKQSKRRKQIVHSGDDSGGNLSLGQSNVQTHNIRRPLTRSSVRDS